MLTTGMPRKEHSRIPTLELPTRQLELYSSRRKSRETMFLKNWKFFGFSCSRNVRSPPEVPSDPASTFGQNHSVGIPMSRTAWSVSKTCSRDRKERRVGKECK